MALVEEQKKWLEKDTRRIILVEAAYNTGSILLFCNNNDISSNSSTIMCNSSSSTTTTKTVYFSNAPYITYNNSMFENIVGHLVKNIAYADVLINIPSITSKIDSSTTVGTLSILNTIGDLDNLIDKAWEGHPIKIFIGDPSWDRSSYIPVFEGVIDKLLAPNLSTLNISIKDKKYILEKDYKELDITQSYIESYLTGATKFLIEYEYPLLPGDTEKISIKFEPDKAVVPESTLNTIAPTCLGKCYNIEPILVDSYNNVYMINGGPITGVSAVKSNGNKLDPNGRFETINGVEVQVEPGYEVDEGIGCIRLLNNDQSTTITCDVENSFYTSADYPNNSASYIIERLLLNKTLIPWDSLRNLQFDNNAELGIFYKEQQSLADTMTIIMNSVGGFYRYNSEGVLELIRITEPSDSIDIKVTVQEDLVERGGLTLISTDIPKNKITLGYGKNWTVIDKGSQASILYDIYLTEESERLANEYLTLLYTNEGIKDIYPLAEEEDFIETLFYNKIDAEEELDRRGTLKDKKRFVYKISAVTPTLKLLVGDTIKIINSRYGFNSGKEALVIGLSEELTSSRVKIEAWL